MNRFIIRLASVAGLTLGGLLVCTHVAGQNAPPGARPAGVGEAQKPVASAPATAGVPQASALTLPGTLTPDEAVDLYAKASGYVSEIPVDIGSRVRKGDLLLRLEVPELHDDLRQREAVMAARQADVEAMKAKAAQARLAMESAAAELKRAEAALRLIRITHERKTELLREKAIPQQDYDISENQLLIGEADLKIAESKVEDARGAMLAADAYVKSAEAAVAVAEAEAARAKTLIEYTVVKAPFDGVVTRRRVDHGAFVRSAAQGAGEVLLTLQKTDRLRLVVDVPETHALLVRTGTTVNALIRANGQSPLRAAVTRTAAALHSETRTMRAEIDLDNSGGRLMPGMFARVEVALEPSGMAGGF